MDLQSRFFVAAILLFSIFAVLASADPYYDFYGFTGLAIYSETASQTTDRDSDFELPTATPSLWPSPSPTNQTNATGKIWGYTAPSGAMMYLDGNYVGHTNVMVNNVRQGPHVVSFYLAGYQSYTQEFYLTANTVYSVVKYLEPLNATPSPSPTIPANGSIYVTSIPSDAWVMLDNYRLAKTPELFQNVVPGTHTLDFSSNTGYDRYITTVNVQPGVTTFINVTLIENNTLGSLYLVTIPSGASVQVDLQATPIYHTPALISGLKKGIHQLMVWKTGYPFYLTSVFITGNFTVNKTIVMTPTDASPSPSPSPSPTISPTSIILHRTTRDCATDQIVKAEEVFPVGPGTGYYNYRCYSRKQEQCYNDGTFDKYYDEWCEYFYPSVSPSVFPSPSPSASPSIYPSPSVSPSPTPYPNAYEMRTYVNDDLDHYVDSARFTFESSRFSSTNTSFNSTSGPKQVTPYMTSVLAPAAGMPFDGRIIYPAGATYTIENQNAYLFAYTAYDETAKVLQAKYAKTGYEAVFSDPIPLCFDTTKNATDCKNTSNMLKNAQVSITFLGSRFAVVDYYAYSGKLQSLVLGKDPSRISLFMGEPFTTSDMKYVIRITGYNESNVTEFEIKDRSNQLVGKLYLRTGEYGYLPGANDLGIRLNNVFSYAYNRSVNGFDISVYQKVIMLWQNTNLGPYSYDYMNWKTNIVSSKVGNSEAISKIQLYNDIDQVYKTPVTQTLVAGESIDIIHGEAGYKFNFLGLETVDYDTLTFSILKGYTLNLDYGGPVTGNILSITSGISNAFQFGSRSVNDVYVVLEPADGNSVYGQVFYINAYGQYTNASVTNRRVDYHYSPDEYSAIVFNKTLVYGPSPIGIIIPELTEDNSGTVAYYFNRLHLNLLYDPALDQFVNSPGSTIVDKIGYSNRMNMEFATKEMGFISYRGSISTGISPTTATISYARNIAHARYTLTRGLAVAPPVAPLQPAGAVEPAIVGTPAVVGNAQVAPDSGIATSSGSETGINAIAIEETGQPAAESLCTDSDGGRAFSRRGILTYGTQSFTDTCIGQLVTEYYCEGQSVGSEMYRCPGECSNGMCIASQPSDPISAGIRSFSEFLRRLIG
ncbi:MAG: PEGA domain-containing protein [Candidatus Micrarchaeota archaeon]